MAFMFRSRSEPTVIACDVTSNGAVVDDADVAIVVVVVTYGKSLEDVAMELTDPSWFCVYKRFF